MTIVPSDQGRENNDQPQEEEKAYQRRGRHHDFFGTFSITPLVLLLLFFLGLMGAVNHSTPWRCGANRQSHGGGTVYSHPRDPHLQGDNQEEDDMMFEKDHRDDDSYTDPLTFGQQLATHAASQQIMVGAQGFVFIYQKKKKKKKNSQQQEENSNDDETWQLRQTIETPAYDIQVDGNLMALTNADLGRIWIYEYDDVDSSSQCWKQIQVLKGGTQGNYYHGTFFGYSVGLKGNLLAVGMVNREPQDVGRVRLYHLRGQRQDNNGNNDNNNTDGNSTSSLIFELDQEFGTYNALRMTFARNDTLVVANANHVYIYEIQVKDSKNSSLSRLRRKENGENTNTSSYFDVRQTQRIITAQPMNQYNPHQIEDMHMNGDTLVMGGNMGTVFGQVWLYHREKKTDNNRDDNRDDNRGDNRGDNSSSYYWKRYQRMLRPTSKEFGTVVRAHQDWLFVGNSIKGFGRQRPNVEIYRRQQQRGHGRHLLPKQEWKFHQRLEAPDHHTSYTLFGTAITILVEGEEENDDVNTSNTRSGNSSSTISRDKKKLQEEQRRLAIAIGDLQNDHFRGKVFVAELNPQTNQWEENHDRDLIPPSSQLALPS